LKRFDKKDLKKLKELLGSSGNILVPIHQNADGDAVGASVALSLVLEKAGKQVNIITPNEYAGFLKWLKGSEKILIYELEEEKCNSLAVKADLFIAIDFNDPERLKGASFMTERPYGPWIMIDHHPDPVDFADLTFSETKLGSSSELLYYLLTEAGYEEFIDRDVAEAIFTGIMTDTGCFSYSCSYPGVYETVAALIKYGVRKDHIYSCVYENFTENRMRLEGFCMNEKMVVLNEYHTAYISLSRDELNRFHHEPGDTEGFVNLPFSIGGIRLTALFIEKEDHVKISFRSKNNFSVHELASMHFRGGGHLNAAGAEWDLPLEDTVKRFTDLLPSYKDLLK